MIKQLFPTQIYSQKLLRPSAPLLKQLAKEINKLSQIDHSGQQWSQKNYPMGYTSYGSMDQLHIFSSTFNELKSKIDTHLARYIKALQWDCTLADLTLSKMWVNVMPTGTIHTGHIHPLSVISGTFYVSIPKTNSSGLKFEDPRLGFMMAAPPKKTKLKDENLNFYTHAPSAGSLVLFESWLRHEVPQNISSETRVSISFNYDWN